MIEFPQEIPVLETDRLQLRPFTLEDAAEVQNYAGDIDVARMTTSIPHPYEDGMADEWIATHPTDLAANVSITWAIELVEEERVIGGISLTLDRDSDACELGYVISKPHWNLGYGTEAAMAVIVYGFESLGLHRIYARHFADNPASGRVMEKAGMQYEGTLRHLSKYDGQWRDTSFYSILEEEYDSQRHYQTVGNQKGTTFMRAVVFPEPETISVETVPDPMCAPDGVVVRVATCGICGTDVHIYRNEYMSKFPLIPGHEFSGEVVEVGSEVDDIQLGDRVAVDPNLDCGHCDFCRREQANHCTNWQGVGVTINGGFAEYCAAPAKACYKLPDSMSDEQAAFVEPLSCVVYALQRVRVWPGDDVLIFGAGPMGLQLLQAFGHSGAARVVMVDMKPERLSLATELGATEAVLAGAGAPAELANFAADGFPIVVDATGIPAVIEQAFDYLRRRGTYLQFGVAPSDATVRVSPYDIFSKDWKIVGTFAACHTFLPSIAWLDNGVVDVSKLVSHRVNFDGFEEAFHAFAAGKTLKVHVRAEQRVFM